MGGQEQLSEASQEEAVGKAVESLESGPFSYPFTYNVSASSVKVDERFEGTKFYNVTVSYVVEPNPFNSPIYTVPEGEQRASKSLNVYVSETGDFIFQSPPVRTSE